MRSLACHLVQMVRPSQVPVGTGTIRLWDAVTGEHKKTLQGHTDWVISVSFSPDGQTLASGSRDRTIRLWDVETGEHKKTLQGHTGSVYSVSFSPDGQTLASGSLDDTIRLWDVETGEHKKTLQGHTNSVYSVSFSPDGQTLASGSWDHTIRLWDVETGEHKKTLQGHTNSVESVSFSPDGQTLASGSRDGTVLLWYTTPTAPVDATVKISVTPGQSPAIGDQLTCPLKITGGENVAGYRAIVSYDTDVLRYVESSNGDYLPADAVFAPPQVQGNSITLAATSPAGESQGDGTLATLTFEVLAIKSSTLKLLAVRLVDSEGQRSVPQTKNTEIEMIQDPYSVDPNGKHYTKWGTLKTTEVFQNYPNPFNPETWIPYQLAVPADVTVTIYAVDGTLARTLALGHKPIGIYQNRARAAYWDGKNEAGELVASGAYFYTLSAGDFSATHKMVIFK